MPWIEYRGVHDAVHVPLHRLGDPDDPEVLPRVTPVEVAQEVADDLTAGGTSEVWVSVPAPRPAKSSERAAVAAPGGEG